MDFKSIREALDRKADDFAENIKEVTKPNSATIFLYPEHLEDFNNGVMEKIWEYSESFEGDVYFMTDEDKIPADNAEKLGSQEEIRELGSDYSEFRLGGLKSGINRTAEKLREENPNSLIYVLEEPSNNNQTSTDSRVCYEVWG